MYDIIGDIHGHADELKALLAKLGYSHEGNSFRHHDRKVIFVGDYIDRGPKIRETLSIVKGMVDSGNAIALMGNHEYNAICYHTKGTNGEPLRTHSDKNIDQHHKTIEQFAGHDEELQDYIKWFKILPLFYETERFRVVHACWDPGSINLLTQTLAGNQLNDEALHDAHNGNTDLFNALEVTLKGKELRLPAGYSFIDKDGHKRMEIRVRWWLESHGLTYKDYSIIEDPNLPTDKLEEKSSDTHYADFELPVFFGHYWRESDPKLFRSNICCLDYSVAKGGKLVGYKYGGQSTLDANFFCY